MAKGFIRGVLWGACVSFGAITLISLADRGPGQRSLVANQEVPQSDAAQAAEPVGSAAKPVSGDFVTHSRAPTPDTLADLSPDVATPAAIPQAGLVTTLAPADLPAADPQQGLASADTQAPSITRPQAGGLTTPSGDPSLSISTEPAQPPAPQPVTQQTAFAADDSTTQPPKQAPQPDVSVEAPVLDSTKSTEKVAVAVEAVQPELPGVPMDTSGFGENNLAQPDERVASIAERSVEPLSLAETDAPIQMSTLDETTSADASTEIATLPETEQMPAAETTGQSLPVDAPQPVVTTEVDAPKGFVLETEAPEILKIAAEPSAPSVERIAMLDGPSEADPSQTAGESENAAVDVTVTLEKPTNAPEVPGTPADAIIAQEAPAPVLPEEPVVIAQAEQDLVAEPDQAEYVASESEPKRDDKISASNVRVNRLPTLGQPSEDEEVVEPESDEDIALPSGNDLPFQSNAEGFENPEGKPLMSIVLIDDGIDLSAEKIGLAALSQFPYPVSFAVNPMLPDVQDRVKAYRAKGFEVLALVDLPESSSARDAEVNLAVALQRMPQAVAVLEGVETGVQTTRESGLQVAKILAETGHGLVTQNQGLNTVQKLAAKEGVPSGVVFRDFDSKGQTSAVIRRFLDQAAFKATQEDGVVMLGRLREETISALLLWSLQDRASKVTMVPISAVLRSEQDTS